MRPRRHADHEMQNFLIFTSPSILRKIRRLGTGGEKPARRDQGCPAVECTVPASRHGNQDRSKQQGVLNVNHIFRRAFVGADSGLPSVATGFLRKHLNRVLRSSIGTRVVVIDIAKIFDQHPGFQQSMEAMKNEVQQVEQGFRERSQQIETLRERMKQYESGTPEYKQLDSQILKIQADGQVEATQKKKEFLEREAQLYFNVYKEIQGEVKTFARMNGIGLVLRYNSAEMEPTRGIRPSRGSTTTWYSRIAVTSRSRSWNRLAVGMRPAEPRQVRTVSR